MMRLRAHFKLRMLRQCKLPMSLATHTRGSVQLLRDGIDLAFALLVGWPVLLLLAFSSAAQRHVFYLHKLPIWWRQDLESPESLGFLHRQVLPLRILTADGCSLFAWIVLPLALYANHERVLLGVDHEHVVLSLLRQQTSLLVIYFHGNAGSVGQTRRTDAYRLVSSGASDRTFVLAFDYRGFARSTGTPSEAGLIEDALAVVAWARTVAGVPTDRIALVAQSLGTAVAAGMVQTLLVQEPTVRFAGIVLCAAFEDASSVVLSYRVAGFVAPLAFLAKLHGVKHWFFTRLQDKWSTKDRIAAIVRTCGNLNLTVLAATSDQVVPYTNTELLYLSAIKVAAEGKDDQVSPARLVSLDDRQGGRIEEWIRGGRRIRKVILRHGGHNGIMKWAPVSLEVLKSFGAVKAGEHQQL